LGETRIYSNIGNIHFTLDVIDAFGVGGFSLETPLKRLSKLNTFYTREEQSLEQLKYIE
jgi:hypothetical protein